MTLDFYGKEFDKYERMTSKPYIGFFTPNGRLVDYNTFLGGSHDQLGNLVSWTFLLWIKQSNLFGFNKFDTNAKLDIETGNIKNAWIANDIFNESNNLTILQKDLLTFLKNAINDPHFVELIKSKIDSSKTPCYITNRVPLFSSYSLKESIYEIENVFGKFNTKELLLLLKDICVQYLGYDSIEKIKANGEELVLPPYYFYYPEDYLTYFDKPRVISTTSNNIYERFFNYLIMEWKIQQLPKYVYNENTGLFEIEEHNFQYEKDETYEKEIKSIKKHIPLKERPNYFIK